ncbi:MAG: scyllo-inosose 3-dehydrogenase [Christensenellaceae bacterium]|jgi:threonine dehydrogenase-like Zn-dependent dehydrogenase
MRGLQITAEFKPRDGFTPSPKELEKKMAIDGNKIWYNPQMAIVEVPKPEPKDDEVLLKVDSAGVCGSDTNFLGSDEDNYVKYGGHCAFPCIVGHEFSGEVEAVGKNVRSIKPGDLIVAQTMSWCGECPACRKGMFNQCEDLEEIGFTQDGGFGQYLVAKEKLCFKVDKLVDVYGSKEKALEAAALIEPAAVAYFGLITRGGGFEPGSFVAVHGCGPVGLSAVGIAHAAGAAKVIAFDMFNERLEIAKKMGADVVYNPGELRKAGKSSSIAIMEETGGHGCDFQVEATENPNNTIPEIEKTLAIGATVAQIGIAIPKTSLTTYDFQMKAARYSFSLGSSGHGIWENVIRMIAYGRLDVRNIIYKTYGLDDAIKAIEEAKNGAPGKILIKPNM